MTVIFEKVTEIYICSCSVTGDSTALCRCVEELLMSGKFALEQCVLWSIPLLYYMQIKVF